MLMQWGGGNWGASKPVWPGRKNDAIDLTFTTFLACYLKDDDVTGLIITLKLPTMYKMNHRRFI